MSKEIRTLLNEPWRHQQYSTLFRRGRNMASPDEGFLHIVHALQLLAREKHEIRMLTIGVAHGEEPLSLLSVLDTEGKKLGHNVELHVVDIRPQLEPSEIRDTIYKHLLTEFGSMRSYLENGLVNTNDLMIARIKPQIRTFLERTFANPKLSRWETPVQTIATTDDGMKYDCIVYNNVHGHITNSPGKEQIIPGLVAKLSPGGILITDGEYYNTVENNPDFDVLIRKYNLRKLYPGIYQKQS